MDDVIYFLFIDGDIIDHRSYERYNELEKVLVSRLSAPLTVKDDYTPISSINELKQWCEYHSGALYPIFDLTDTKNKAVDFVIVDSLHLYEWRDDIDINKFRSYCRNNKIDLNNIL